MGVRPEKVQFYAVVCNDCCAGDESWDINHVVGSNFVSILKEDINCADIYDGALSTAIPKGDMRNTSGVYSHGYEEVEGIDHVAISATFNQKNIKDLVMSPWWRLRSRMELW